MKIDMTEVKFLCTRAQRALDLLEISEACEALDALKEAVSDLEETEDFRDEKTLVDFFPRGILGSAR